MHICIYVYSNETAVNLLKLFILANILVNSINGRNSKLNQKAGRKEFFLLFSVQIDSGAHPASYPVDTTGSFPKPKAAGSCS
jgi:hypothetical protein